MTAPLRPPVGIDLLAEIQRLKEERNAVILAHYYQKPELQDLADFVGDSLDLSRKAAATDADVIAFCGVRFMAETAKILSPEKTVILPDMDAGCSLEDSCPPDQFAAFRAAHPDHIALTYINCSAAVKAQSDIIVTSSPAPTPSSPRSPRTRRSSSAPTAISAAIWRARPGAKCCCGRASASSTRRFRETELLKLKAQYPDAPVAAHPECPPHIIDHCGSCRHAPAAFSTSPSPRRRR